MSERSADVLIVGAGVAGLFTAWMLAQAGLRVRVLERGRVGQGASWAAGGILSPLHPWQEPEAVQALSRRAQALYPQLCTELAGQTGIDPEWTPSGLLLLEPDQIGPARGWAAQAGEALRVLEAAELAARQPGLGATGAAIELPAVAQVRNPRLLQALKAGLPRRGVDIEEGRPVLGIVHDAGRVQGVRTPTGAEKAGSVILAAGAWSGALTRALPPGLPEIGPVKGQMLLFRAQPGLLQAIVLRGTHYLVPRRDGRILAGSTVERAGFDARPSESALLELQAAAFALLPALRDCALEAHWAGLRPAATAAVPYAGPHPEIRGLYLHGGHFRHGILTSVATAEILAGQLLQTGSG